MKMGADPRRYSIMSKQFVDDGQGNVSGVNTVKVEWKKDETGRWNMSQVEGMWCTVPYLVSFSCHEGVWAIYTYSYKLKEFGMRIKMEKHTSFHFTEMAVRTMRRQLRLKCIIIKF